MIKILFICHGNICRSTMSEYVMKYLIDQAGLASEFILIRLQLVVRRWVMVFIMAETEVKRSRNSVWQPQGTADDEKRL